MKKEKCYKILGLNEDASFNEVKKAYNKLVIKYHPDHGGDVNKMSEINMAFNKIKNSFNFNNPKSNQNSNSKQKSDYNKIITKLKCPKCHLGNVMLIKNTKTDKGFFACSLDNCDYDGGPFNQKESLIKTLDYCPNPECTGLTYERDGQYGKFRACTFFPKTGCKAGRNNKSKSKYKTIKTDLECPECGEGDVVLIKNLQTEKSFFTCSSSNCDYYGGPFNQDESVLDTIDYCPDLDCDGITFERDGPYGTFRACSNFPITGCKAGR